MRNKKNIFITDYDYEGLNELFKAAEKDKPKNCECIEELKAEIERAKIVTSGQITGDTVTMNSRVLLEDLNTHEQFPFQVVFPSDADLYKDKISVLAPIGTALLGYKVGDSVKWKVPGGMRKLKIKEILYQPESEGDMYQ